MGNIAVTIFEDNNSLRAGFEELISMSDDFYISGAYADVSHVLKKINESQPNIVLMDIQMPGMNGIEATTILHTQFPELPVIMLTVFEDTDKVFAAICAGACGYLLKNSSPSKILEALHEALNGGSPMTPSIARKVLTMVQSENKTSKAEFIKLTEREKEVLSCLMKGMSYKMIAANLNISFETVRTHMKKIYEKLHVKSLQEAVSKAFRSKIV